MAINLDHVTEQITVTDTATNASLTVQPKGTGAFNIAAGSSGLNLSNGGTVTAIALTNNGGGSGGYTGFPTITISPPTTAGGVQATATVLVMQPITASVQSGGTGYTLNDVVSWVGGTPQTVAATFRVSAVSGGVVTAVTAVNYAPYLVLPTAPVSTTGGTGTGLTLTSLFYAAGGTFTITNAGSGYVEQPTVTFSGGGGSGAAAYASVGGASIVRSIGNNLNFSTPSGIALSLYDASATTVNYFQMQGRAAGAPPLMSAGGSDTNINFLQSSKGTGQLSLYTNTFSQEQVRVTHTASAVNYVQLTGNATTGQPSISAQGSDTNISMAYIGKGIGGHIFSSGNSGNIQFIVNNTTSAINYLQVAGGISGDDPSFSSAGSQSRNIRYRVGSGASHLFETGTYGNLQAAVSNTASAVNWVQITGAATGGQLFVNAAGSDSNIGIGFTAKLFANINFFSAGGFLQFQVAPTASAVNYAQITGAATGNGVTFSAQGSDTNVQVNILAKGASGVSIGSYSGKGGLYVTAPSVGVNYGQIDGANTGGAVAFSAQGTDTNINLNLTAKGTGSTKFNSGNGEQLRVTDGGAASTGFLNITGSTSGSNGVYLTSSANAMYLSASNGNAFRFFSNGAGVAEQLRIVHTASTVNYVQVTGSATGNPVVIVGQGSDASVPIVFNAKGPNGYLNFTTENTGNSQLVIMPTSSAVNQLRITGSITGFGPRLYADGSDTNIPLVLQPKGTGALQAQQTDSTATGGNIRGANVVDLQTLRTSASQVASGFVSNIAGGYQNTASGGVSGVLSGTQNNAAGALTVIAGGIGNTTTLSNYGSSYGGVVTGYQNTVSGVFNFIGGGFTNSGTSASAVTTQSATMNATTAVTLAASNASIKIGQIIAGTSINNFPPTYVAAISGTSLTLSQVASGSSTSTLSFYTPHSVVVGGGNNTATGSYSFIGGGGDAGTAANRNVASGDYAVVVGGRTNTASGIASFVGGGGFDGTSVLGNTASNNFSSVVGGAGNAASGFGSFVGGGAFNSASATYSSALCGNSNAASGQGSAVLSGYSGTARAITGNTVFAASQNPISSTQGGSQTALLVIGTQTTDATATVLRSNTSAAGTTNQVILPNNSAYFFTGEVVAGVTGGGNTKGWTIEGVIKRGANAASTALVGTPTVTSTYADAGASTWVIAVTADTTNGGLAVTFTGQASTTIRTVAQIRTTEMTF